MSKSNRSDNITRVAYRIVNSLLAPGLCGSTDVSDEQKVAACNYVLEHWPKHSNGLMMPGDVRQVCECWSERWGEFFDE